MRPLAGGHNACSFLDIHCLYIHCGSGAILLPLHRQAAHRPRFHTSMDSACLSGYAYRNACRVDGIYSTPRTSSTNLFAGVTFQALGVCISTYMYSIYLGRLMTTGLPRPDTRPGIFIAVGPPAFTGLAFLGISQSLADISHAYTTVSGVSHPEIIADIFRIVALSGAIFLWATAFWFFCIALVSVLYGVFTQGITFHLVWWAFVIPNVGFTVATINIGQALMSKGILWIASVMTILLVAIWLFVGMAHIRAVWKKQILWPGKDEDHDQ
jgi:tellurite resistance protein TehA-like permease